MAAGERREYRGGAAQTTLNGAITNASATIVLTDATGWPDGSVGPFFIVVDPGLAGEEKIKCLSRTGASITVVTSPSSGRGADGTAATSHVSGAVVQHVLAADDADKLNAHIADLNDNHPSLLNTTRHDTTTRHAVGSVIAAATPGSSAPGDIATQGASGAAARADHTHGRERKASVGSTIIGAFTTGVPYAQVGTAVVNTTAGGGFDISLPNAFGSGFITATASPGDVLGNSRAFVTECINNNMALGHINGVALYTSDNSPVGNATIRVNFVAWGWD